jgi:hypothetical protein
MLLLKLFLDNDGKWKVVESGPMGSYSKSIDDKEILKASFTYDFAYEDIISDVFVRYRQREVSEKYVLSDESFDGRVSSSSDTAEYLHLVKKQKTYTSYHTLDAEAQTYCDRLKYALGDRQGSLTFQAKNRFFDNFISDVLRVDRTRLPGYAYDKDVSRTRDVIVQSTDKTLERVTLQTNDQKGIEDNSGSW